MADALVIPTDSTTERPTLLTRMCWAFQRARSAVLYRPWVIKWEMRDNSRSYGRAIAEAKARGASRDNLQSLEAEAAHFYWELEEELEMLESSRLLTTAKAYFIEPPAWPRDFNNPDDDPNWRRGTTFKPDLYLTRQAMHDLRTKIRAERKARREPYAEWIKIIGGLGGIVFLAEKLMTVL